MSSDPAIILQMQSRIQAWEQAADDRALFLRCYQMMTSNTLAAIQQREFSDPDWVGRLLRHFAEYYFNALQAYERQPASAPRVWQLAHAAAGDPQLAAVRKLLAGVNAHINYDLVLALVDLLRPEWAHLSDGQRASRHADYGHVNAIIGRTIDAVQDQVLDPAMPVMQIVDQALGPLDEFVIARLLEQWRENVWRNALRLLAAGAADEQARLTEHIEQEALKIGGFICGTTA